MSELVRRYRDFERTLIQRFGRHPFLLLLSWVPEAQVISFLLQLGFLSVEFVKWYERTKQGFGSEQAKELVRQILRDEVPTYAPTHQDDRLTDLFAIGVSKIRTLNVSPSSVTRHTVKRQYALVQFPQTHYDLRALITIRIAGEVLVGETYRYLCPVLESRFGLDRDSSRFYWEHFRHDELHDEGEGHANSFDPLLEQFITTEEELRIAMEAAEAAFALRYHFLDQFTTSHRLLTATRRIAVAAIAAAVLISAVLFPVRVWNKHKQRDTEEVWMREALVHAREFDRECDQSLARMAQSTGDTKYVAMIGTSQACREVWGEGP